MSNARLVAQCFMDNIRDVKFLDAFSLLAEDGEYTVIGKTAVSRTYKGRQDLFDNLLPALGGFIEPPVLKFEEPIVDGDRVVMLASGSGKAPHGDYDQPYYAFVARVRGDEFSQIIEFMDTAMVETAILGKKIVDA